MTGRTAERRNDPAAAHAALTRLRDLLHALRLPLEIDGSAGAARDRDDLLKQLDDYILPRYEGIEAPLLAVVGGSTGAGKSTLVNSLVLAHVATSSPIRPTTRRPMVLHHPDDEGWFLEQRILPGMPRVRVMEHAPATPASGQVPWDEGGRSSADPAPLPELEIRATTHLPPGLALLDAPDIDSVVEANRYIAHQLMAAADLWIFVTTAARYADAVPWDLLREAAARDIVLGIVLDRVPGDALGMVRDDLAAHLADAGLGGAPLFTIPEVELQDGLIPDHHIQPMRVWLGNLAADASARAAVVRRTLAGAVQAGLHHAENVAVAVEEQLTAAGTLDGHIDRACDDAMGRFSRATADGSLLRGEVLTRWQEFVGTSEWFRRLQSGVGRIRDRVGDFFRGRPAQSQKVEAAVEDSVMTLLYAEARQAVLELEHSWRFAGGGRGVLDQALAGLAAEEDLRAEAAAQVVDWQRDVRDMIREEGAGRRNRARTISTGVNALGVTLMMMIFATTGGVTGAELGVAGGTAAASQAVLVAVFGEDAVRRMARKAREALDVRARATLDWYVRPFRTALEGLGLEPEAASSLRATIRELHMAEPEVE